VKPEQIILPSNKKFGWFLTFVLFVVGLYFYVSHNETTLTVRWLWGGSILCAAITIIIPKWLAPLNRVWFEFGILLGKIISPLILGIIFFIIITPTALICRLFGRDELRLKRTTANTYWLDRKPPGPAGDSFNNQF
jgi:hypothetical protein